ncbi:DoxX family protein [Carbonactinospora thermoautotrophica]|uniref:DoxX family protein n=1 Tax=Carbonactinospora thermoautotrophica TaxID=1469144 RepID=UPI00226D8A66|nr:DoxX family protein [Carbonactinospora thermoautotrophica]MCX9191337.1 DoxX family protein [Carbonactinospora thermoautotrophica]
MTIPSTPWGRPVAQAGSAVIATATGLLLLRVVVGLLTMAAHGSQKLFGWFGGEGFQGTAKSFAGLGYEPGTLFAVLGGSAEFFGGLLLALGLLTPLGAAAVLGMMLNAIVAVHLKAGFFAATGGFEYPLLIAAAAATLGFTGPGRFALDAGRPWGRPSLVTGVGVLGVALAASVLALLVKAL